ncbi:efflux RND transporter permease subunit, partial [Salmonella enterica subsp. enterica serovar Anatum]|nr:efflux RND transporter permease subunit [Salmonella enterica subsp. enterica serovar Anatum]
AMVLSAVFVPMAFFGGTTGAIYRQFSITIVSAMVLSVLVAMIGYLFPAFYYQLLINSCSVLLRLITGISPVSFSAPGKVFSHAF